jgi:hypothetical protein
MANLTGKFLSPGHTKERKGEIRFSLVRCGAPLWLLCSLAFTACSNFWLDKPEPADVSGGYGIVEIHLDSGERTLRPDSIAAFSGYRIKVWYREIVDSEAVIGAGTLTYQIRMESWTDGDDYLTITVAALTGDISNNGAAAVEVAWWQQNNVAVSEGKVTALQVELKPEVAGGEGVFTYTVSFPANTGISTGSLVFMPMSQSGAAAKISLPINSAVIENGAAVISGTKTLNAGYYLVTADLLAVGAGVKSGTKTAVAHIYKNLPTPSDDTFAFASTDFTALTVLSTADYGGLTATLDAFADQGAGEYTIVLDTDESAFTPYTLTTANFANKIITLRGGAYDTVKLSGNGSLLTLQSGVSLALKDVTLIGGGEPIHFRGNNAAVINLDGASLVMEVESYITGNLHNEHTPEGFTIAGGIYAENNSSVVVNGGSISGNIVMTDYALEFRYLNCIGGGIALDSGSSIVINSGSFGNEPDDIWTISTDCSVVINGGAYNDLIVQGRGNIKINAGNLRGGYVGGSSLEIHSGTIESNLSASDFTMYGGEISSNSYRGVEAKNVTIYNGKISQYSNSLDYGIYAEGDVIIHNAEITNNNAGVYSDGNITIYNGTFTDNKYAVVTAKGTLTIRGGTFTGNGKGSSRSGDRGFDTWAAAAGNDVIISGGTFTDNMSGVFFRKSFDLSGGVIRDNETDITVGHETVYNPDETTRGVFILDAAFAAKAAYRPDWNWAVSGDFTMNAGQARNVTILGATPPPQLRRNKACGNLHPERRED